MIPQYATRLEVGGWRPFYWRKSLYQRKNKHGLAWWINAGHISKLTVSTSRLGHLVYYRSIYGLEFYTGPTSFTLFPSYPQSSIEKFCVIRANQHLFSLDTIRYFLQNLLWFRNVAVFVTYPKYVFIELLQLTEHRTCQFNSSRCKLIPWVRPKKWQ